MLKKNFILIGLVFVFYGCDKISQSKKNTIGQDYEVLGNSQELCALEKTYWFQYYQKFDSTFLFESFESVYKDTFKLLNTHAKGIWDETYDSMYFPFTVWNADSSRYVDFDSDWWFFVQDEWSFDADQEVKLGIANYKKVHRLTYRGPSFQIEDALWCGNSLLYLFESTVDEGYFISKYDFEKGQLEVFQNTKLIAKNDYLSLRLRKLIKKLPHHLR